MKKNYLFIGAAAIMMAGCASDDLVGDENISSGETPIGFNMQMPAATRTDGTEAHATKLNNEFIVWGEKNEQTKTVTSSENLVFKNYRVQYTANSANTTVSNTKNWEYVGIKPYNGNGSGSTSGDGDESTASVYPSIYEDTNTKQTIKYWDFGKTYTFTAVSALKKDITAGKVKIKKTEGTAELESTDKGYTIELGEGASVADVYVAKRITTSRTKPTTAGTTLDAVQLSFSSFQSKVRFGIYENIPGYKVVITAIKYGGTERKGSTTEGDKFFGINGNFIKAGANTKYKVTYTSDGTAQAELVTSEGESSVTPASKDTLETAGTQWLSTSFSLNDQTKCIGETAAKATYDRSDGYTTILPNTKNSTNLKLEISYDLYSEDTGEKISVGYKTAEVPAKYCQWKPNYAYTYIFKITDKSAELYPITFDAVVVESETGSQETITTVDEPSITTYVKGKTASDEYAGGDEIFAYAQDGTSTAAMTSDNMKLYTVTTTDGFTITEASVKHALEQTKVTTKITATPISDSGSDSDKPEYTTIPREDNATSRGITGMKWKATAGTTYAVEYIKTENSTTTKYYKIVIVK